MTLNIARPQPPIEYIHRPRLISATLFGLLLILISHIVYAEAQQQQPIRINQVKSGQLLLQNPGDSHPTYSAALLLDTQVDMQVNGMLAQVTIKQQFKNTSKQWLEGIYVFPLPENSAVNKMSIHIGERIIVGKIKEKQAAKKIYQQAKAAGKQASLVEQERPNLFTNSISNIAPGKDVVIEISYLQRVSYNQGEFSLRFPMTLTQRYIPGNILPEQLGQQELQFNKTHGWAMNTDQVKDARRITPPMSPVSKQSETLNNTIHISATINMSMPLDNVSSSYHPIKVIQTNNLYRISLAKQSIMMNRDFVLSWRPLAANEPQAALFNETLNLAGTREHYLLMMLLPPQFINNKEHLPREIIFVVDTSGSMGGSSIKQAKSSLQYALSHLSKKDRFNIIEFNSKTHNLFNRSQQVNEQTIEQAQSFIASLQANGGTEMAPALIAALKDTIPDGYIRQTVFITDGSVGNEDQLFAIIHQQLKEARLFTIGIGSAPNSYFMSKAAQFGRGTFTYIGSIAEVQNKMSALFSKLSAPVLSHLKVQWPQGSEVYPKRIPDLYLGEPLLLSARVAALQGDIIISGQSLQGPWQRKINLQQAGQNQGISSIWARSKIDDLMDRIIEHRSEQKFKAQIIEFAIKHQLLSKYTSFIAVDETPVRAQAELLQQQAVANLLPRGQTLAFPQTATPAMRNILLGVSLLVFLIIVQITGKCHRFQMMNTKRR